jgi:hypothetical protein
MVLDTILGSMATGRAATTDGTVATTAATVEIAQMPVTVVIEEEARARIAVSVVVAVPHIAALGMLEIVEAEAILVARS